MSDPKHTTELVPAGSVEIQRMHPLVGAAMAAGQVDPATLRELLAVQKEWEANEARKAYTAAIVGLKRDLPRVIGHDKRVKFKSTDYTHASLAATVDAVVDILTAHGFTHRWNTRIDSLVYVTCVLTHKDGHFEECPLNAAPDTSGMKNDAQARMSTVTMLSRYSLLSILGLATADMSEPTGERPASPSGVDTSRNLNAVRAIRQAGNEVTDAEAMIGRPVSAWTKADRQRLRAWLDGEVPPGDVIDGETGEVTDG